MIKIVGHTDPLYKELIDDKGRRFIKILRDKNGNKLYPGQEHLAAEVPSKPNVPDITSGKSLAQAEAKAKVEKFTYEKAYSMTKKAQVDKLKELGLKSTEIKKLRLEEDRVEKLMELLG